MQRIAQISAQRMIVPICCGAAILAVSLALVTATFAQKTANSKAPAKKVDPVHRLLVADIPGLPPEFAEKLTARKCSVPQFDAGTGANSAEPSNVIHGEFARAGQEDWAVLCSNGQSSTIVIFWGKVAACPASLARLDDAHYVKPPTGRSQHYSRSIRALGENEIGERAGMKTLRPLKHQGIDDRFVGKSSAFFYCTDGKWRIFPAKDSSTE